MNKEPDRNPRKALGRGISTLLTSRGTAQPMHGAPEPPQAHAHEQLLHIPLDQLRTNEEQPRESFDAEKLQELARSIEVNGVIQPITVRRAADGTYAIIAGERRWRAARLAGLKEIPAIVRTVEQDQMLELALIENLQREDLNPVETAAAFHRLAAEHGLSHEQIAERTGKDRSTITNFLRLLKLSPAVLNELIRGTVTVGHARALLNIPDFEAQRETCEKIVANALSVRQTEQIVKKLGRRNKVQLIDNKEVSDANVRAARDEMGRVLGTRVKLVSRSPSRGRLEIEYYSKDDLDRIYGVIVGQ